MNTAPLNTGLYCALDFDNEADARAIVERIKPINPKFKIGLELFCKIGPSFVRELVSEGCDMFLDLKCYDIPNTVAGALRAVGSLGASYTNIHISGGEQMARAAIDALKESSNGKTKLLGVTVLTSMGQIVAGTSVEEDVLRKAKLAHSWGLDGVVCSARELEIIRKELGPEFETMVPGIRPAGESAGDQARIATPQEAVCLGATNLVIGRPITKSPDPKATTQAILESMC